VEEIENPEVASAKEAAVLLAREMYERGDFKRAIVRRTAVDLFSDDVVLECGHRANEPSHWENSKANCLQCARDWIANESKAKLKV
jgi:hypothetical protein